MIERAVSTAEIRPKWDDVVDALLSLEGCTRYGARFIPSSGEPVFYPYAEILKRAQSVAGSFQSRGMKVGECVALVLPTSVHFLDVFLGVQLAGGVPVALYPPFRLGKLDEYFKRTQKMLSNVRARFLVTGPRIRKLLGPAVAGASGLEEVLNAEELSAGQSWTRVDVNPEGPALLQYSSGTTADPKAVQVSHRNLLANLEMLDRFLKVFTEEEAEQGGVCWLPLYHDMGLIGCMYSGLYHPGTVTYIAPEHFVAKPAVWFQTLSRYRAVVSAAPDFAYGLCLFKVKDEDMQGLDLSHWRLALNGAEPINIDTMMKFCERFARWGFRESAMTPVYGLAEAVLTVTFSDPTTPPKLTEFARGRLSRLGEALPGPGRRLPALGRPMPGLQVEIWDEDDVRLEEGRVGTIMVRGPSIMPGYFNDPELTSRIMSDGWLDTGDLGFFFEGELYVSGRSKDLIIIRGRNFSPQEFEELLYDVEGLRKGCVVAVSADIDGQGEQLIILGERAGETERADEEIADEIRDRILNGISMMPYHIALLQPGTLPRTSSGKIQRSTALKMFWDGELAAPKTGRLQLMKDVTRSQIAWASFHWKRKR